MSDTGDLKHVCIQHTRLFTVIATEHTQAYTELIEITTRSLTACFWHFKPIKGMTWVKEKPESTTVQQSLKQL